MNEADWTPVTLTARAGPRHALRRAVGLMTSATLLFLTLVLASSPAVARDTLCRGVTVRAGQNLQSIINRKGSGATFCLRPGTYVIASPLRPKARQRFVATERRRAILTGKGVPGSFAFDANGVTGVKIRGLVIRDFVPPDLGGYAALKAGVGWHVIDNRIGPNSNTGLYYEARTVVRGNLISQNSLSGVSAFRAHRSRFVNNVLSRNGKSRVSGRATAVKWFRSKGVVVRGNYFHHNWSNSLWLDSDNLDALVEDNIVTDNFGVGIHYEVSCAAAIRRNVVKRNSGPGILVVASRNVNIRGNTVNANGDGIQISHQDRRGENGAHDNCRWVTGRVRIHHNSITMTRGSTGAWTFQVSDGNAIFTDGRVRFFANRYLVGEGVGRPFLWANSTRTWSQWRSFGQDPRWNFPAHLESARCGSFATASSPNECHVRIVVLLGGEHASDLCGSGHVPPTGRGAGARCSPALAAASPATLSDWRVGMGQARERRRIHSCGADKGCED